MMGLTYCTRKLELDDQLSHHETHTRRATVERDAIIDSSCELSQALSCDKTSKKRNKDEDGDAERHLHQQRKT